MAIKIVMDKMYNLNEAELLKLLEDAITELANTDCPYCQSHISSDVHLVNNDIPSWLKSRLGG